MSNFIISYTRTNFVTFGKFHDQPVVFKYFDWRPRKEQEEKALRLLSATGLVPKLCPIESDSILVWEQLQGTTLDSVEKQYRQEHLEKIYYQLGMAMAKIVELAPFDSSGGRRDLNDIKMIIETIQQHSPAF